jgi:hypothetical protein
MSPGFLGAVVAGIPSVPSAPNAPIVNPEVNQDFVSWTAPFNGGAPITLYGWESTDAKSGTTLTTSVTVTQEGSTSQSYRVRAQNIFGFGPWSAYSDQVTTTPPFFPPFFPPYFPYFCPSLYTVLYTQPSCTAGFICSTYADGNCGMWAECVRC